MEAVLCVTFCPGHGLDSSWQADGGEGGGRYEVWSVCVVCGFESAGGFWDSGKNTSRYLLGSWPFQTQPSNGWALLLLWPYLKIDE